MNMSDTTLSDRELLARYTRYRAEDAFAEIVRRHLGLVHSAALRQVRSPQLAEEVAQCAFLELARHAGRLAPDTILAAWLYQVTHRTALNVVRRESRRQLREQIATEMNAMNATTADLSRQNPMEADWTHIEPLLDEAMHALDETDRAAVLLRYFENKSLREVGQTLGTSDDTAQKRVSRAVERLREFFAQRGVTVGASGLVVVLSASAVQAAPVGMGISLTAVAVNGATAATANMALVSGGLKLMAWTTTKTAIAVGLGVLLIASTTVLYQTTQTNPGSRLRLPVGTGTPAISMGASHGIILASDGSLWSWGENFVGWPVLGLGNVQTQTLLHRIGNDNDWTDISSSFTHCLALKSDGTIWGWGQNIYGQLGDGASGRRNSRRSAPVPTVAGNDWKQVAAGGSHSLALKTDGTLWAWGNNWAGQLGIGSMNEEVHEATPVGAGTNWTKVWASGVQTVGQQSDGSLWFWGSLTGSNSDTNRFLFPPASRWTRTGWTSASVISLSLR